MNDPLLGWQCYQCNLGSGSTPTAATFTTADSYHVRAYIEPLGLHLVAQAGTLSTLALDLAAKTLTISFDALGARPPCSYLRLQATKEGTARPGANFVLKTPGGQTVPTVRNAYQITPNADGSQPTTVVLSWQ